MIGKVLLFLSLLVLALDARGVAGEVGNLSCEYQASPLNVDAARPRLAWLFLSDRRGDGQSSYQILVASDAKKLAADQGDLWDSGKVESGQTLQISYAGKPLVSSQQCFWKVRAWDRTDRAGDWSKPAMWAMGLLTPQDWSARWIGAGKSVAADHSEIKTLPIFRKGFTVDKPVARAVIYICGLGQFELHLDGRNITDSVLDPGWTDYRKTCLYVCFDLTAQLNTGSHAIGILLGNGMYNVPATQGRYTKFTGSMGMPCVIAQLQITYADGTTQVICTDPSWKITGGPVTFSSIYGGEDYDARLEQPGWDGGLSSTFDNSSWQNAVETRGPGGALCGSSRSSPPIVVAEVLKTRQITHPKPDVWVYDMGQNCAQIPLITVRGPAGSIVHLTPAEVLNKDGTVSQGPSGGPAYDQYTLKGTGNETWGPRFFSYGSRYIQVQGATPSESVHSPNQPVIIDLQSRFITSSSASAGEFSCSNPLFNRTAEIIRWAMRNNMVSILTDCPHRERLGWLEQTHLVGPSLMYNFQIPALYSKMCRDMSDAQGEDGLVPDIAPEFVKFSGGFRDSPEWGSAAVLIPWQLYEWYGDSSILDQQYQTMKRYVDYLGTRAREQIVSHGLGDWYDLGPKPPGPSQLTPTALTATAFYYRDIIILEKTARLLHHDDDAARYLELAGRVRDAFNRDLYHRDTHSYATGSQTSNAIPLVLGLAPQEDRNAIVDNIVNDVRQHQNGLTAGDVGYRYLLRALADGGRSDVIFDMNSRSDRPGYGMIIARGATSLTEAWDARRDSSQDHFMLGHIMEWFYSDLVGIQSESDAFGKIIIKPTPVGDVTWAKGSYQSARGGISSSWKIQGKQFLLDVTIPPGTTATVQFPSRFSDDISEGGKPLNGVEGVEALSANGNGVQCRVQSGNYHFQAVGK